jgi:3-carboxy-cis,cis-muconate cycloisomerase
VSLGGAVGNLSVMGAHGRAVRAGLAAELALADSGANWHTERDSIATFAGWQAGVAGSLSKFAEDVILHAQTGIDEITLKGSGNSSTMPQKQNPVRASAIVALAKQSIAMSAVVQGAAAHRQNRDGAAWFTESLALPALCTATSAALLHAVELAQEIVPDQEATQHNLNAKGGLAFAEAISFILAKQMPRSDAQRLVTHWCSEAVKGEETVLELAKKHVPDLQWDVLVKSLSTGNSIEQAHRFAENARQ